MKKIVLPVLVFVAVALGVAGTAGALDVTKEAAVSMNCSSIVGQLENVRYYDRRAREYLGNRYERMISGYVVNLNVRLLKNNMADTRLQTLQAELAETHGQFKSEYGRYAIEMDRLIEMDCVAQPGDFYAQLATVREGRATVRGLIEELNTGLARYGDIVTEIKEQL